MSATTRYYAAWLPAYGDPEPFPAIGPLPSLWPGRTAEEARARVWRWIGGALDGMVEADIHVKPWGEESRP